MTRNENLNYEQIILFSIPHQTNQRGLNHKQILENKDNKTAHCNKCDKWKPIEEFQPSNIGSKCRECCEFYKMNYNNSIDGHLDNLLQSAKQRPINRGKNQDMSLNVEDLINILENQKRRCFYSNID